MSNLMVNDVFGPGLEISGCPVVLDNQILLGITIIYILFSMYISVVISMYIAVVISV